MKARRRLCGSLWAAPTAHAVASGTRIGIPRALTTHSLFPLYSTFFSHLGMEVVLSDVDPRGDLKFAFGLLLPCADRARRRPGPGQARRGPGLPAARRAHAPAEPVQRFVPLSDHAGRTLFPGQGISRSRLLSPVLDFTNGYETCSALVEMAVARAGDRARGWPRRPGRPRCGPRRTRSARCRDLGKRALDEAIAAGKPAILLAGHSYNAFTPEASQSVGKKLSSMGVTVIPADCLPSVGEGPTAWHFANQILNAVGIAKQHPNLFLLCVSNFSCTIDAFTHSMLASEMGSKPYLILEIDAHTADAGVQTRLEAFLDIIHNYRDVQTVGCAAPSPPAGSFRAAASSDRTASPCRSPIRG